VHGQLPAVPRTALRHLARRAGRRADQPQAAPARSRLHCRQFGGVAACSSPATPGGPDGDRACCAAAAGWAHVLSIDSREYRRLADGETIAVVARAPDDLAWLFYTSGTTGQPKGVMLSQRNLLAMTLCYFTDVDQATAADSILYAAPMSHGAGMYNFAHVLVGARHVVPGVGWL
jgi:acyl-CoA synthetase (AMP-forming)/AMP-acid ligase II